MPTREVQRRRLAACGRVLAAPFRFAYGSVDRWDVLLVAGAGLMGGGVWAQWGAPWACMLWGLLLLAVAMNHEWKVGK